MYRCRKPPLSGVRAVISARLDRRRLALVADRFGSTHDGERLAALEAAGRLLAAANSTWRDLIDGVTNGQKSDHRSDADNGTADTPAHHRVARQLLQRAHDLTKWERTFLSDLVSFRKLSEKQQRALDGIRQKMAAHDARRWS